MSLSIFFQDPPPKTEVNKKTSKTCQILNGAPRYRILDIHPPQKPGEDTYVRIQIKGTRASFSKSLTDVYSEDWLPFFSTQEAAKLGELAKGKFHSRKVNPLPITRNVVVLGIFFIAALLLSNILAFKLTWLNLGTLSLGRFSIPFKFQCDAAFFVFPLTFFINDVLTEVYGFKTTRLIIWSSLAALVAAGLAIQAALLIPASPLWEHQEAFTTVLNSSWRIFTASSIAFVSGGILNSFILSRLKVLTHGKHLWFRATTSTFFGALVDTMLFFLIGFLGPLPASEALGFIALGMAIKMSCEVLLLPFTYWLSNYLKRTDKIDAY